MKIKYYNLKTIPFHPCFHAYLNLLDQNDTRNEVFKLFFLLEDVTNNSQSINRKLNGTIADTFRTKIYIHASKTSCQKCLSKGTTITELEI